METGLQPIQLIPSAKRLIRSLRDMGYDFAQAVADIVDNSIEAKATLVAIDVEFDGDDSWVRIADNGTGMRPEELREAMRYGAERDYDDEDLGKFGLGLKTASMSQCECLSVASRWNPARADIAAYTWDLSHIERTNRWEILPVDKDIHHLRSPLRETTGTVVLWQRLDRILGYKHPYGELSRKRLSQTCREIETHLGMVFHRFLSGEHRRRKLRILLNGNEISPWDPFCRAEPKTKELQHFEFPIDQDGVTGGVLFKPYILPARADFSTPEASRAASGPGDWNQQQGFYIYRAGRLIQSGGWSNLRARDEHTKLARISVDFSPNLDEAFKINVAKMRVQMPAGIREEVRQAISTVARLAREVYDKKPTESGSGRAKGASGNHSGSSSMPFNSPQYAGSQNRASGGDSASVRLTIDEWSKRLLSVAAEHERPLIAAILKRL